MTTSEMKLTGLQPEDLVRILTAAGWKSASLAKVQADIESGAPVASDGTISLFTYGAWLLSERSHG